MARCLVTGASGQVGSALARRLCEQGHEVHILLRDTAWHPSLDGLDLQLFRGDLLRRQDLWRAMQGCDQVYHVAGLISYKPQDAWRMQQVNVHGTALVVDCALALGVQKLVHTSSTAALGFSFSPHHLLDENTQLAPRFYAMPYLKTKYAAEQEVLRGVHKGLVASIVNPSTILGPGDEKMNSGKLFQNLAQGMQVVPPGGSAVVSLEQVLSGHLLAMAQGQNGRRYVLSSLNLSYQQLFAAIARVYGQSPPRYVLPRLLRFPLIPMATLAQHLPGLSQSELSADLLRFSFHYRYFDASRAQRELGWQPDTLADLPEILRSAQAYYAQRGLI